MNRWCQSTALVALVWLNASLGGVTVVSAENEPRKVAFLAGVSKYQKDGLTDLSFAEEDVRDLAAELRRNDFQAQEVVGEQATLVTLQAKLADFFGELAKLNKDDVAVLAFSGHGLQLQVPRDGKLVEEPFFCPVDAQRNNPDSLISLNWIIEQVEQQSGSSQNLLIIDACRNNPAKGVKGLDGGTADRLPNKISILFSSSAGGRSYESDVVRHGVFTHFLLEGIQGGAADRRGRITWLNLASYVMEVVPVKTPELMGGEDVVQRPNLLGNLSGQPVLAVMAGPVANRPSFPVPQGPPPLPKGLADRLKEIKGKRPVGPTRPTEEPTKAEAANVAERVFPNPIHRVDVKTVSSSPGIVMVKLPAGEFLMGSPESEVGRDAAERLPHLVKIARPFLIGAYEVTEEEYDHVLTGNTENTSRYPATLVSWYDAVDFCNRLSAIERLPLHYRLNDEQYYRDSIRSANVTVLGGNGYRLPSEAEWEYACRAGAATSWSFGRDAALLGEYACFGDATAEGPQSVGLGKPNDFGLFDMHGNVQEWCHDVAAPDFSQPPDGQLSAGSDSLVRIIRGGSFADPAWQTRSAVRQAESAGASGPRLGFRVARSY